MKYPSEVMIEAMLKSKFYKISVILLVLLIVLMFFNSAIFSRHAEAFYITEKNVCEKIPGCVSNSDGSVNSVSNVDFKMNLLQTAYILTIHNINDKGEKVKSEIIIDKEAYAGWSPK
jgi:hypothetical protein